MILTIHKWSDVFENADTRKRQRLGFFHCPSGCDSNGYVELVTCHGSAGLLALGVFQALCQHAATMPKDLRGKFVRANGSAMPLRQIALLIRVETCHLEQAVEILAGEGVKWLAWEPEKPQSAGNLPPICRENGTDLPGTCQSSAGFVQGQGEGKGKAIGERENAGAEDDDLDIGPKPYVVPPEPPQADLPNHAETARKIVGRYPRQERIENALKIVYGHLIDGEDPKRILAGVAAGAVVIRSATPAQERFVPSAEAYFRDKRWADDPQTLLRAQVREDRLPKAPRAGSSYGENTELPP